MRQFLLLLAAGVFLGLADRAAAVELPPLAQDFLVDVWQTDDGLPQNTVTGLAQTPDGYLWVGTMLGGLARFDGVHFEPFQPGNPRQLKSIEIQSLNLDQQGALWVSVVEGAWASLGGEAFRLERWGRDGRASNWLARVLRSDAESVLCANMLGQLLEGRGAPGAREWKTYSELRTDGAAGFTPDVQGKVWFRTSRGELGRFDAGKVEFLPQPPGLSGSNINALATDARGRLWVGTERELAVWEGGRFRNMTPTNGAPVMPVEQLALASDGGFWVRGGGRLRKAAGRSWVAEAAGWEDGFRPSPRPPALFADAAGGVWLAHYGDGLWYTSARGRVSRISEREGLPSGLIECWLVDREGNTWVGTLGGGLCRLRPRTFRTLGLAEGLPDKVVRSVAEDADGNVWIGTAGAAIARIAQGKVATLHLPSGEVLGRDLTVCPDRDGNLWVGTVQDGVWWLRSNRFTRPFPSEALGTVARAMLCDRAGRMWIGNEFGLYCWSSNRLEHFTWREGFAPAYVLSLAEDAAGALWMGTAAGELRRFANGRFTSFRPADAGAGGRFWALHASLDGTLWIGTLGSGLLRFHEGEFHRFTARDGLPDDNISQILDDRRGSLWLGSRGGISRVSRFSLAEHLAGRAPMLTVATYGRFDGLPTIECSSGYQPAAVRTQDGRLWFATAKGVVVVHPDELQDNPLAPPVVVQSLWVDGAPVALPRPATNGSAPVVTLAPGPHACEFRFAGLSFVAPDKVRFRWRVEGLDDQWVEGGATRSAKYTALPPGHYRFQVQACNNDGVWNETGAALPFRVQAFLWQQTWFKALGVATGAGLLFAAYVVRVRRLRQLQHLRLRIARDLHDEVGANLGSISLLAQVMEQHPNREDAVEVRRIAVQTVDSLRDIVWFIDPAHEKLADLVQRMQETARAMLQGMESTFTNDGNFEGVDLPLNFRRNMLPVFKEALHNLLKHSGTARAEILVRRTPGWFEWSVTDHGSGFDPAQRRAGNGLKNMRRRAEEMGATLEINSPPGEGTTLRLRARLP